MNRADLAERIADVIGGAVRHPLGVTGMMLDDEIKAGRRPVQPGSEAPFDFPADDWVSPCVVSVEGQEVRLVAILAKYPGNGALRRLVANIRSAGLEPVVVAPVGQAMPAILAHWGWKGQVIGSGWDQVDEWRPHPPSTPNKTEG